MTVLHGSDTILLTIVYCTSGKFITETEHACKCAMIKPHTMFIISTTKFKLYESR